MKKESKRCLKEITFHTGHYQANLLAVTKVLGLSIKQAIPLCRRPGELLYPDIYIYSELSTDEIIEALDEYEIVVRIEVETINQ